MVSIFTYVSCAAAAVATLAPTAVDAHQKVSIPAPTFTADKETSFNPLAFLEGQGIKVNEDVTGFLQGKGVKTLRDYLDNKANYKVDQAGATFECGYTNPNGARQPIPANGMMRTTGYSHDGPCEVWIDETRVLGSSSSNCHADIGATAVSTKIDWSSCKGDCMLRWYWLGKRLIGKKWSWQVYKECIPIRAGAARSYETDEEVDARQGDYVRSYNETLLISSAPVKNETRCGVKKN